MTAWDGALLLGEQMVVYAGPAGPADRHAHHAVQVVATRDAPLAIELEDGTTLRGRRAVIPSGVAHRLDTRARELAAVYVDAASRAGRELDALARRGVAIPPLLPDAWPSGAAEVAEHATAALAGVGRPLAPRSPHVTAALAWVDSAIGVRPATLAGAAAAGNVSPSRLTHVFTHETGIPFTRYVLWRRLRRVVEDVAAGMTLTAAAADAGFSDSAHLTRTFRRAFGLPPSALQRMRLHA